MDGDDMFLLNVDDPVVAEYIEKYPVKCKKESFSVDCENSDNYINYATSSAGFLGYLSGGVVSNEVIFTSTSNTGIILGKKAVTFKSLDKANPAKFYLNSAPAYKEFVTQRITSDQNCKKPGYTIGKYIKAGKMEESNDRVINQLIVAPVLTKVAGGGCNQLQMGLTELQEGSVWNTMPQHTHNRRMEAYFYFNVPEGQAICHQMGRPQEQRLVWLHNEQAITAPEWSVHSAAGTSNYMFIWGMGGENLNYGDMDKVGVMEMR